MWAELLAQNIRRWTGKAESDGLRIFSFRGIEFPRHSACRALRKLDLSNSGPVYIKNLTSGGKTVSDFSDWLMLGPNMTKADIHIQ